MRFSEIICLTQCAERQMIRLSTNSARKVTSGEHSLMRAAPYNKYIVSTALGFAETMREGSSV